VEAPFEDVTRGVLNAIQEVEELSGRKILDGERIIIPANDSTGVDIGMITASRMSSPKLGSTHLVHLTRTGAEEFITQRSLTSPLQAT